MRSRESDTASRRKCAIVGRNARKREEREAGGTPKRGSRVRLSLDEAQAIKTIRDPRRRLRRGSELGIELATAGLGELIAATSCRAHTTRAAPIGLGKRADLERPARTTGSYSASYGSSAGPGDSEIREPQRHGRDKPTAVRFKLRSGRVGVGGNRAGGSTAVFGAVSGLFDA
jgi:hypothetical protein